MITALELENFKAFGSRTRIDFAPITLIFGENSAGKSSILQALNLLKQTRESRDHGALLLPRTDGGIVDLGSFEELVFDHDPRRDLSIRVDIEPPQTGPSFSSLDPESRIRWKTGFGFEICLSRRENDNEVLLSQISLFLKDNVRPALRFEPMDLDDEQRRSLRQGTAF